jgi:hypothetical protein
MTEEQIKNDAWDRAIKLLQKMKTFESGIQKASAIANEIGPLLMRIDELETEAKKRNGQT